MGRYGGRVSQGAPLRIAQEAYPNRVIRIVTPATGGGSDVLARMIAPALTESMGQQVIVDNRGSIAAEIVAKSPPDGYTILIDGSPLWLLPLFRSVSWDPLKDFAPLTLAVSSPSMLVVHPSLPVKSVREFIALAKARPGPAQLRGGHHRRDAAPRRRTIQDHVRRQRRARAV